MRVVYLILVLHIRKVFLQKNRDFFPLALMRSEQYDFREPSKQLTFLADISVKGGEGGGQNPCPLSKCKFLLGEKNAWDVLKRKNMQRNFPKFVLKLVEHCKLFLEIFFYYKIIRIRPFSFQKQTLFYMKNKNLHFAHMSVKA